MTPSTVWLSAIGWAVANSVLGSFSSTFAKGLAKNWRICEMPDFVRTRMTWLPARTDLSIESVSSTLLLARLSTLFTLKPGV